MSQIPFWFHLMMYFDAFTLASGIGIAWGICDVWRFISKIVNNPTSGLWKAAVAPILAIVATWIAIGIFQHLFRVQVIEMLKAHPWP